MGDGGKEGGYNEAGEGGGVVGEEGGREGGWGVEGLGCKKDD